MSRAVKTLRSFAGFALRLTAVHILTYVVIGGLSYWLIAKRYWTGPEKIPGLRDPNGEFIQRWMLPAQILRGLIYSVALYPLRQAFLDLGRWGGFVIASIMLLVGSVAGIDGLIESCVYSAEPHPELYLAHLPEVVLQSVLFGYLVVWWDRRYTTGRISPATV